MAEKRRKKGEGHWRITKAGNIEYRFRYTDEYGRRKYKSVTGFTEDHCYEKAEQFLEQPADVPAAHYIYEYGWQSVYTLLQFSDVFLLSDD